MKKISIMLTSYNLENYIDESISSVVNQEMPCDWELLIGDDGSNDGTIPKIKEWQAKYPDNIRYYVNERPKTQVKDGYRAAKNRASLLEKAEGDYLIYLDGDDCWLGTEKLKSQFAILEDPANADCSCCAHNIEAFVVPENKKFYWVSEEIPAQKIELRKYWSYYYFHTNTLLFRKECKSMLLGNIYRQFLNDIFITFVVLQFGKVYYINKVWARYNMTGNGLWTGHNMVYGYFRNITMYDLERNISPKLWYNSMRKHSGEIIYLINHYSEENIDLIAPVIKPLDPYYFKTTFLFAKKESLSFYEKVKKLNLLFLAYCFRFRRYIQSKINKKKLKPIL